MAATSPSLSLQQLTTIVQQGKYNLIPIYQTLHTDLETPVSAYIKVCNHSQSKEESKISASYSFLLESVEGGERQARYSYIGTEPYKIMQQTGVDPLIAIETEMAQYRAMPVTHGHLPSFTGGGVGYISYDSIQYWEPKVNISQYSNTLELPDSIFMFCRSLVIFDHVKHTVKLVAHAHVDDATAAAVAAGDVTALATIYDDAVQRLQTLVTRLLAPLPLPLVVPATAALPAQSPASAASHTFPVDTNTNTTTPLLSNTGQHRYETAVTTLQHHIHCGDIIQAVPAHRCARLLQFNTTAFDVYRSLRVVNPSPYMFFLDLESFYIVGASPEQLVKVDAAGRVTTHPIAGTRPRGTTEEEDQQLAAELLADTKERAEHIMLVDLGRNDVGRVAVPGSVRVESLMHIERYSHVMHIVSVVSAQLSSSSSCYDAFRAVFPAGTLSGAPKIRAMQLIASIERDHRGVYGGAVGYVSFSGVLDVAIAIRTLTVKQGVAYLQAGAGVVYDSVPTSEWEETMKKMGGVVAAILEAEKASLHRQQQQQQQAVLPAQQQQQQMSSALQHLLAQAKDNNVSTEQLYALLQQASK